MKLISNDIDTKIESLKTRIAKYDQQIESKQEKSEELQGRLSILITKRENSLRDCPLKLHDTFYLTSVKDVIVETDERDDKESDCCNDVYFYISIPKGTEIQAEYYSESEDTYHVNVTIYNNEHLSWEDGMCQDDYMQDIPKNAFVISDGSKHPQSEND